jgi:aspartyl-tRNA(Asn)/glutamyl-tRNA(Gln) amidotransferase subunit C
VYDFAPFFLRFCDTDQTMADTSLDAAQIGAIAHLARLDLRPAEIPVYQDSLSRILSVVGELVRADNHERYQTNAPRVEAGLYLVPKVIE